jgi:dUTPase
LSWDVGEHHATLDGKQVRLIPTGLRIKLAPNMVGLLLERGSVVKTPFVKRAGVIDPGYTDEIFVNLASLGSPYILRPGDKLPVQLVVVPCDNQFTEVTQSEWTVLTSTAKRGDGKVGSSN